MKYIHLLLIGLCFFQYSLADSRQRELEFDSVSIGYMPSRGAFYKGEPEVVLEAKSLAHHKNKDIERFFIELNELASKGITDNATRFHQASVYINASYQGKQVRLYYVRDTGLDKFRHYEEQWKRLHGSVLKYLNKDIDPSRYATMNKAE